MGSTNYKKTCVNTICPTDCSSLHYIHKLHRFCYDENYRLKKDAREHFRINGKDSNVITGFVGLEKSRCENGGFDDYITWELNMTTTNEITGSSLCTKVKHIFDSNDWDYGLFIKELKKIKREVLDD